MFWIKSSSSASFPIPFGPYWFGPKLLSVQINTNNQIALTNGIKGIKIIQPLLPTWCNLLVIRYIYRNWKANANRGLMMVDQFKDEVSQDIYCSIDLGRTMKMLFGGHILLTFAALCKTSNSLAKSMICCKMWKLNSKNRILNDFTNLPELIFVKGAFWLFLPTLTRWMPWIEIYLNWKLCRGIILF